MPSIALVGPYRLPHDAQHHVRLVRLVDGISGEGYVPIRVALYLPKAGLPAADPLLPVANQLRPHLQATGNRNGEKIEVALHGYLDGLFSV